MPHQPLPRAFYQRDTHAVARDCLGKLLVRVWRREMLVARIVETESYVGEADLACHASKGRTPRTETLFGPPGHAYVYLCYGIHELLNFVTERDGFPAAVLIRAVEPVVGIERMERNRGNVTVRELTNGPGKLTQALQVSRTLNDEDLTTGRRLFVADDGNRVAPREIVSTTRIGVEYAGKHALLPWRYYLRDSQYVSRK